MQDDAPAVGLRLRLDTVIIPNWDDQQTTIGACILVGVVLLLCGTQFVATWMTCRMLEVFR